MSEQGLIKDIQIEFSKLGHRIFRQNVGSGWTGHFLKPAMATQVLVTPQDVLIRNARILHAGLCKGSSDLIGWRKITITPDMIGKEVAIFTAIEVKHGKTKVTEEQERFIKSVNDAGGFGKVVYELHEAFSGFSATK